MVTRVKKTNIFSLLFGTGIDNEDYSQVELPPELKKAQADIDERNVLQGVNFGGLSKKSGINVRINPDTEKAMRKIHENVVAQKQESGRDER